MAKRLPEINILPTYSVRLHVIGEDVEFVPFTVEQEKALLTALEEDKTDDVIRNYETVLKQCIKTDIDFDSLSVVDYLTLIINVRAKSKGEAIELSKSECAGCSKPFEFSVRVEDALKYDNVDVLAQIVEVSDALSFEVRPLGYRFLYGIDRVKTEMDMFVHTAAHCIGKVFFNKEIFKPDPEELKARVIRNLRRTDLEEIFRAYEKLATVKMDMNVACPHCGHKENIVVNDFLKSLR
jgi:hypothetical protein